MNLSALRQQASDAKRANPDAVVLIRDGALYYAFDDLASIAYATSAPITYQTGYKMGYITIYAAALDSYVRALKRGGIAVVLVEQLSFAPPADTSAQLLLF